MGRTKNGGVKFAICWQCGKPIIGAMAEEDVEDCERCQRANRWRLVAVRVIAATASLDRAFRCQHESVGQRAVVVMAERLREWLGDRLPLPDEYPIRLRAHELAELHAIANAAVSPLGIREVAGSP
jgi:hypothetical protein